MKPKSIIYLLVMLIVVSLPFLFMIPNIVVDLLAPGRFFPDFDILLVGSALSTLGLLFLATIRRSKILSFIGIVLFGLIFLPSVVIAVHELIADFSAMTLAFCIVILAPVVMVFLLFFRRD